MDTRDMDARILEELLRAAPHSLSGSKLAEILGVSRVSIWSHLERLRTEGFSFEAVRNRGYRLLATPAHFHPTLTLAWLQQMQTRLHLHYLHTVDSTNSEALRRLAQGDETPMVVVASRQTAGRGRLGRTWYSEDTGNLYMTFAFRPLLPPARMQRFTLWMGLRLCDLFDTHYRLPLRIKWPNDLVFEGRKVAGMLTEAHVDADLARQVIFGVGLNVNTLASGLPEALRETATSLRIASGGLQLDINELAARLIARTLEAYDTFLEGLPEAVFRRTWIDYDWLNGKPVTVSRHEGTLVGMAAGIDGQGSLIVHTESGQREKVQAGDVTLTRLRQQGAEKRRPSG